MLYIIHTLIGILIGSYFSSLSLIILLAIISHFILDWIPHWDSPYKGKLNFSGKLKITRNVILVELADGLVSLFLIILFYLQSRNLLIIIGALASLLPDMMKVFYFTPLRNNRVFQGYLLFHHKIQKEINWAAGLIIQLIIGIILYLLIVSIS